MKYVVTIGERMLELELDGDEIRIDGTTRRATLERVPGSPEVRLRIDGVATPLLVDGFADGTWRLMEHGAVRDVQIEDERSRHIRMLAGAGKNAGGGGALKAPMPGLVVRIAVAVGDQVAAGAGLVILEAMKMENELKAAGPGVVTAIHVAQGVAVEKGQLLLEIGPLP